jgi:TRAP transporter TAXI family solute receptor
MRYNRRTEAPNAIHQQAPDLHQPVRAAGAFGGTMKNLPRIVASSACALVLATTPTLAAEQFINVLTGGTSGVYYPLGVALAGSIGKAIPGAKTSVQATKASVENLNLLQAGRGEIAFTLGDSLSDAWKGNEEAGFKTPLAKLRGIAAIYPNYIQIVARADAGIKTLADLKGKKISVGAPKSGTELNARVILAAAGITYKDFAKVEYLPFGESVELMKNRQIDVTLQSAGLGVSALRDLATSMDVVVVSIPPDVIKKTNDAAYLPGTIPANTYRGQTADVPAVAVQNYLVTHEGVSNDTVYAMTKALWTGLDQLVAAHSAAKAIELKRALEGMPLPLHPGAEKYYREVKLMK